MQGAFTYINCFDSQNNLVEYRGQCHFPCFTYDETEGLSDVKHVANLGFGCGFLTRNLMFFLLYLNCNSLQRKLTEFG